MGIIHSKNYSITKKLFNKIFIQKIWKLFIQNNYSFFWKIDYRPGLPDCGATNRLARVSADFLFLKKLVDKMQWMQQCNMTHASNLKETRLPGAEFINAPTFLFNQPSLRCLHLKIYALVKTDPAFVG